MAIRNVKYIFGRLNLIAIYDDKREFMRQGFQGGQIIQSRGSGWGFFEVNLIEDESGDWFEGYLVKYKPETEEEKVVLETQQIEDEAVRDRVISKSRFFVHVDSGIIAYRPRSNQISEKQFAINFVQVFRENHEFFFGNAEILSINEDYKLLELLREFARIQVFKVSLHPSNPSNRDLWKRTDERLRKINAADYQEVIEANPNGPGLNVVEDEEATGKIAMATDGYGKASVSGILNGEPTTVSTEDNPVTIQAPSDEAPIEDIFKIILQTYRTVKTRFVDGKNKTNGKATKDASEGETKAADKSTESKAIETKEEIKQPETRPEEKATRMGEEKAQTSSGEGAQIIKIDDDHEDETK